MKQETNIIHKPRISIKVHKLGPIPSIGIPLCTCRDDAPCKTSGKCYAMHGKYKTKSVQKGLMNNYLAYKENPDYFFEKIAVDVMPYRFFRWFTSGDIVDARFLEGMVYVAKKARHTKFLAYTKKFSIVNDYLRNGGKLPKNLKIIFSGWGANFPILNPFDLPTSHVIFKDPAENVNIPEGFYHCSGKCNECAMCWKLKNGEAVAFEEHR